MGTILKVSCSKCDYTKDLYCGCGISGCNINMIQNRFSDKIFSEFQDYKNNNMISTYIMTNEICYCPDCKEIKTVAVLTYTLKNSEIIKRVSTCSNCGGSVEFLNHDTLSCPKCGTPLEKEDCGMWD